VILSRNNRRGLGGLLAFTSFVGSGLADAPPAVPALTVPTIQCIHRVLKASRSVESVSFYSIDGSRFAVEYVFRNKDNQAVTFDMELIPEKDGSVFETNKVPREISQETMTEAETLESRLDLPSKCHFSGALDDLIPEPKARADWREIDWPNG